MEEVVLCMTFDCAYEGCRINPNGLSDSRLKPPMHLDALKFKFLRAILSDKKSPLKFFAIRMMKLGTA